MDSLNTYKYITSADTTTFAGETGRVVLGSINFNKALSGTVTVLTGSTPIAEFAASTPAGEYLYSANGTLIQNLTVTNAAAEDITVLYRNI